MKLNFKTISSKAFSIEVDPSSTILSVKKEVSTIITSPAESIRLIYCAKVLNNDTIVEDAGIEEGKTIIVSIQKNQGKRRVAKAAPKEELKLPTKTPVSHEVKPAPNAPIKDIAKEDPKQITKNELITTPVKNDDEIIREEPPKAKEAPKIKEDPKVLEKGEKPECAPLPMIVEKHQLVDPPNFNELVANLESMGFETYLCQKALRAAVYNPNRAVEFLLTNYIPEIPHLYDPEEDKEEIIDNGEEDYYDYEEDNEANEQEMMRRFLRQLTKNPEFLPDYLQDLADNNPAIAPLIKNDPAAFLVSIGLNPKDFDLSSLKKAQSEYEKLMEQFTFEEREAIHRLENIGFDTMMVIQVFEACGRNEQLTEECLKDMK